MSEVKFDYNIEMVSVAEYLTILEILFIVIIFNQFFRDNNI